MQYTNITLYSFPLPITLLILICSMKCTDQPEKEPINKAMVYEFLRHYVHLGLRVMVYDRDGMNMAGVFDSEYAEANPHVEDMFRYGESGTHPYYTTIVAPL